MRKTKRRSSDGADGDGDANVRMQMGMKETAIADKYNQTGSWGNDADCILRQVAQH